LSVAGSSNGSGCAWFAAFEQAIEAKAVDVTDYAGAQESDGDNSIGAGIPTVYVTTTPMDLIVTDGPPEFVSFNGTPLLYVKNTWARVFKEPTDQELYVFVSGQWYRAWSTDGPWEHLTSEGLPADIAKLPDDVLR
jgi:hypothetical protein